MDHQRVSVVGVSTENRQFWELQVETTKLAAACLVMKALHEDRRNFWEKKKSSVMAEIRATGLVISETLGAQLSNSATKGYFDAPDIQIKPELKRQIGECAEGIERNATKAKDYGVWAAYFDQFPVGATLPVKQSDYGFFFGKMVETAEENGESE